MHDEHRPTRRSRSRCRGSPTSRRRPRPSACSATSSGRATSSRCSASSSTASERNGPGDLGALLNSGAVWDVNVTTRSQSWRQSSRLRMTMPVRGFGFEERRLLGHAQAREGGGADLFHGHRRAAAARRRRRPCRRVWRRSPRRCGRRARRRRGQGGSRRRSGSRRRRAAVGGWSASAAASAPDCGTRSASPSWSTRPIPPRRASRAFERGHRLGTAGAGVAHLERGSAAACGGRAARRATRRWIAPTNSWSSASSTTRAMIAAAPASADRPTSSAWRSAGSCARSRSGGDRRRARPARPPPTRRSRDARPGRRRARARGSHRGRRPRPRGGRPRRAQGRSARRRATGPRSGPGWRGWRGAARDGRCGPSAASAREGGCRRRRGRARAPGAEAPRGSRSSGGAAVLGDEAHAVRVERGLGVGGQNPGPPPLGETSGRGLVLVDVTRLGAGQDQADRVVGVGRLERIPFLVVDDVVGRRGHCGEVAAVPVRAHPVAQAAEGKELGHRGVSLSSRGARLSHTVSRDEPLRRRAPPVQHPDPPKPDETKQSPIQRSR